VRILYALRERASADVAVFNVGSERAATVHQVASRVLLEWGGSAEVRFSGRARPGDPFSLIACSGRLSAAGLECNGRWETGVADYVRWFRSRSGAER
jgi:UDP-glucose 4-epimerase